MNQKFTLSSGLSATAILAACGIMVAGALNPHQVYLQTSRTNDGINGTATGGYGLGIPTKFVCHQDDISAVLKIDKQQFQAPTCDEAITGIFGKPDFFGNWRLSSEKTFLDNVDVVNKTGFEKIKEVTCRSGDVEVHAIDYKNNTGAIDAYEISKNENLGSGVEINGLHKKMVLGESYTARAIYLCRHGIDPKAISARIGASTTIYGYGATPSSSQSEQPEIKIGSGDEGDHAIRGIKLYNAQANGLVADAFPAAAAQIEKTSNGNVKADKLESIYEYMMGQKPQKINYHAEYRYIAG